MIDEALMQIAGEMLRAIDAFCLCAKLSPLSSLKGTVRTGVCVGAWGVGESWYIKLPHDGANAFHS